MVKVLVIGANGFIGQHLVGKLLEDENLSVIGYGKQAPKNIEHIERYQFLCGDYRSESRFADIFSQYKIDLIYHLISTTTPRSETSHAIEELQDNVIPTIRILQAMSQTNTKKLIFSSSGGTIYGVQNEDCRTDQPLRPICSYGAQKVSIEAYLSVYRHTYGLDCKIARIANPYGLTPQNDRRQGIIPILINCLMNNLPVTLYGNAIRDYIYIDEVIDALVKMQFYNGKQTVFQIGTGVATDLHTVISMIEKICDKRFSNVNIEKERICDVHRSVLDISDTIDALAWRPRISLEEGVLRTYQEICRNK